MSIMHITESEFEKEVLQSEQTVLVDFWATWCGPCRMLAPILEEIAEERTDVKIAKIDVDKEPNLAMKYGIMSIPTLMVVKNGEVVSRSVGVQPKAQILANL